MSSSGASRLRAIPRGVKRGLKKVRTRHSDLLGFVSNRRP